MTTKKYFTTQQLVMMGILIALNIILSRFLSISAWNLKIGFAFLPVVIAAIYLGPWQAALVGALGDFLGATLFPIAAYFPGFTFTACLVGFIYGCFLHKKQGWKQILSAVLITEIGGSLILNTIWISILFGSPLLPLITTRAFQVLVMILIDCVLIRCVSDVLKKVNHVL